MSDAVIIWGMVCATILVLVFGLVGIFAWIDRYTYSEIQRIRTLETQVRELREWRKTSEDTQSTVTVLGHPVAGLTKSRKERRK